MSHHGRLHRCRCHRLFPLACLLFLSCAAGTLHAQGIWFADPITTQLPETVGQFGVDHLNGDPFLDVAFGTPSSRLYIYLNDGTGRFYQQWSYTGARSGIGTGDLNNDGAADIVMTDVTEESFLVYYNEGPAGFSSPVEVQTVALWPRFARIANLDGDTWGDVIVVGNGIIAIHWGGPQGPIGEPDVHNLALYPGDCGPATEPIEVKIADLTGDELLDIAVLVSSHPDCPPGLEEKGLGLLRNYGNRDFPWGVEWPFREPMENTDDWLDDFDVADLNNDELLDVGIANESLSGHAEMRLFINAGDGVLEEVQGVNGFFGLLVAFGDLDGDENADLAWSMEISSQARVERGNGAAQFEFQQWMEVLLRDIAIAELDGNPRPELIGYHGANLHVVPNLTYLDPSAVEEPELSIQPTLRVLPSIVAGDGCWIEVTTSSAQSTAIEILDILGRRCATLLIGIGDGTHSIRWSGTDSKGQRLPSGAYWIRACGLADTPTAKVLVLR